MNLVETMWGRQRLDEGVSDVLYHKSNSPMGIFETDTFHASLVAGREVHVTPTDESAWYMSTARTLASSYMPEGVVFSVVFELDGKKLMARYKGKPVEFFQSGSASRTASSKAKRLALRQDTGFTDVEVEAEDRILLREPTIPRFSRFVRRIIVVTPFSRGEDGLHLSNRKVYGLSDVYRTTKAAIEYGEKHGVQVDLLPYSPRFIHPNAKPLDHEAVLGVYEDELSVINPPFTIKSVNELMGISKWWAANAASEIGAILHLYYFGWVPYESTQSWEGADLRKDYPKPGWPRRIELTSDDLLYYARDPSTRPFVTHIVELMKADGVSRLTESEVDAWVFGLYVDKEYEETVRNEAGHWRELEQLFPEALRNWVEIARQKLKGMGYDS